MFTLMGTDEYSTYDAKARFSELIRKVRAGRTITITYYGEPVAELRPLQANESMDDRKERLTARGAVTRGSRDRSGLKEIAVRPGALARFLEDRGE
jgi:prevent-host-death family protein